MNTMNTATCPYCKARIDAIAIACVCGASRRKVTGKWTSQREGRRNDIILGGVGLLLVLFVLSLMLTTAYAVSGAGKKTTTTVSPNYGECAITSPRWPECR